MVTPTPAALAAGFKTDQTLGAVSGMTGTVKKHFHVTNDSKAEVETAGYFNPVAEFLSVGDEIAVSYDRDGSPGGADYIVTNATADVTITAKIIGGNASSAEVDRVADLSARVVNTTAASLALTVADHEGKIVTVNKADGAALTLPSAVSGVIGARFMVVIGTTISSNSTTISAANASDSFVGSVRGVDDDVEGATGYQWNSETNDDRVTLNGAAQGGKAGDYLTFTCIAANTWLVEGSLTQSGGSEATPFSAAVS